MSARPARLLAAGSLVAVVGLATAGALGLAAGGFRPPAAGDREAARAARAETGAAANRAAAGASQSAPGGPFAAARPPASRAPGDGAATATAAASPTGARALVAGLERALAAGERAAVVSAARALRAALIASPELAREVAARLVDPAAPIALREALAAVLGSLPGDAGKALVLAALRDGRLAGLERAAILALAIAEPQDEHAFERDDQPFAVEVAPGLVVFVDGRVRAEEARAELAARLGRSADPAARAAAARALRDSTFDPQVREALRDAVARDADPDAASESAAALASWALAVPAGDPERRATIGGLLDAAPGSPEAVRLRVAVPLAGAILTRDEEARVHALASSAGEPAVRRFAVDLVGRRLEPDPSASSRAPGESDGIDLLVDALRSDASPDVREAAALALGRAAGHDPRAALALASALGRDPDWEVRATAARSLSPAAAAGDAGVRAALAAAAARDPHEAVRAIAAEGL